MVEQKPSKLTTRVRFPSPAPKTRFSLKSGHAEYAGRSVARNATEANSSDDAIVPASEPAQVRPLTAPPCPAICRRAPGEVAEWLKAADCKSARASVRWFESSPLHHIAPSHKQTVAGQRYLLPISRRVNPLGVDAFQQGVGMAIGTQLA